MDPFNALNRYLAALLYATVYVFHSGVCTAKIGGSILQKKIMRNQCNIEGATMNTVSH